MAKGTDGSQRPPKCGIPLIKAVFVNEYVRVSKLGNQHRVRSHWRKRPERSD